GDNNFRTKDSDIVEIFMRKHSFKSKEELLSRYPEFQDISEINLKWCDYFAKISKTKFISFSDILFFLRNNKNPFTYIICNHRDNGREYYSDNGYMFYVTKII